MESTNRKILLIISGGIVSIALCVYLVGVTSILWNTLVFGDFMKPTQRVEINIQDPFIESREKEFHLSRVIPKYDEVISAIELYYEEHGSYPETLILLIPKYLPEEPGIYLRSGDSLTYEPQQWGENTPSFTFSVRGHYPFPAFMHGWNLLYCPATHSGCAAGGDRHIRVFQVNERWIWIHSSAL